MITFLSEFEKKNNNKDSGQNNINMSNKHHEIPIKNQQHFNNNSVQDNQFPQMPK
jgi:hypothetical protein